MKLPTYTAGKIISGKAYVRTQRGNWIQLALLLA
jgi:hypothetical protein